MTPEYLAGLAGVLLTLAFSYLPGLSDWYETKDETAKRQIMLGLLFVVAAGALGITCAGFGGDLGIPLTCDRAGVVLAIKTFATAVIANQAFHRITKPSA